MGLRASVCLTASCGLFLIGCPTFSNLKTARALDQGEFQFTVAPEIEGFAIPTTTDTPGQTFLAPQIELAARVGITDGFDLGLKLWVAGLELDSTISLLRGGFDLALAPGVGFFGVGGTSSSTNGNGDTTTGTGSFYEIPFYIPILAGVNVGYGHQFVFGVEAIPTVIFVSGSASDSSGGSAAASGTAFELFLGGTVGFSFKVASGFRIMPEFNVFVPVVAAVNSNGSAASEIGLSGTVIFQGGLGFSFGGDGFGKTRTLYVAPPM